MTYGTERIKYKGEHNMTNMQVLLKSLIEKEYEEDCNEFTTIEDFFEFFSAKIVLKSYTLSDEEIMQGIKGAGNDGGCDAIYIFCNGLLVKEDFLENREIPSDSLLEMIIIQSKTSTSFNEDVIMKWKTVSINLFDLNKDVADYSKRYNEDVRDSFQLFRDVYTALIRKRIKLTLKYWYISEGEQIHPNVKQQGEELKENVKGLFPSAKVSVEYFGAEKIMEILNTPDVRDYQLILADNPISLGVNKDYIALVSLGKYYNFITNGSDTLEQSIFESNIRDYQGSVVVNKEIHNTLDQNDSIDFWWLNNGITILASNISPVTSRSLIITEPEIVNGLQTSNEIYNFFSEYPEKLDSDSRHVLVRIIVPSTETVRDNIILATNNQTSIPKSSLRVSDSIHWQIEMFFKQRGLFYDRRKNHYKNLGKKRSEIISVSYLAQSLIAVLLQKPNYSRARPSTLLTNNDYYDFLYKGEIDLIVYYKIIIWANRIKNYLRQCGLYNTSQQGDLLFYVLYYSFARKNNSHKISPNDVQSIDAEALSDGDIAEYCNHIYEIYHSLGGTGKIAKGSQIIEMLIREFE